MSGAHDEASLPSSNGTTPSVTSDGGGGRAHRIVDRLSGHVRAVQAAASRPAVRRWMIGLLALAFITLATVSFLALPDESRSARPGLVAVLVFVTTPATLLLNALEYRFMAGTLGHRIGVRHAVRVGLLASIANYLPAPGGVAVRTVALNRRGSTVRSAVSINSITGLVWAGVTGLAAGLAMVTNEELAARGVAAITAGSVLLAVAVVWLQRRDGRWRSQFRQVLAIEVAMVFLTGSRIWIALAAIGQPSGYGAAIAISGSAVISAALGIFPGGLGLRELLAGGIAAVVGVPAAAAVAASAIDRVASQIGMALAAALSGVRVSDLRAGSRPDDASSSGDVDRTRAHVAEDT
jgi:uncharacterized membrane protein YbhN (UPF0104 family)